MCLVCSGGTRIGIEGGIHAEVPQHQPHHGLRRLRKVQGTNRQCARTKREISNGLFSEGRETTYVQSMFDCIAMVLREAELQANLAVFNFI